MSNGFGIIGTLVVEDSEDERELLRFQLRYVTSVKVVGFANDGVDALAYLHGVGQFNDRQKFPYPDLMLLDFKMPRCDGMQVLELMGQQQDRPRVVLWSSILGHIDVRLALNLGADMVCSKPDSPQELANIIQRLEPNILTQDVPLAPWKRAQPAAKAPPRKAADNAA
jgi:two-component system response regulator